MSTSLFGVNRRWQPVLHDDGSVASFRANWWLVALRGVVSIAFGVMALLVPGATMLSLILLFAAYMIVDGVSAFAAAIVAAKRHRRWSPLALEGIVSVVIGLVAMLWPAVTLVAFVLLVAGWALLSGLLMTAGGLMLGEVPGRWWLLLGGVASLAYGVLLVVAPLIGAVVLTWWFGAYAIVFGVALVALGLSLKGSGTGGTS